MEDFIEIIFYVVILVLSGIGSLMKNRKKQQKTVVPPRPSEVKLEPEIEAEVAGKIIEICVADGEPVEYGQPLMYVE